MRLLLALLCLLPLAARAAEGPQPMLPTTTLTIVSRGGARHGFTVEGARTPGQQEAGLMFRTSLPADHGMLFDFGPEREVPMWMKNTLIPLDMVFIRADGTIRRIAENTVPQSLAEIPSGGPVRAVLELQGGITARLDIRVGDRVEGAIFPAGK
jgi:uncharacterized membrane protein (UPF0127 family)